MEAIELRKNVLEVQSLSIVSVRNYWDFKLEERQCMLKSEV